MELLTTVWQYVLAAIHWSLANPDNVGLYVGTATAIAGSISGLKAIRCKWFDSTFRKFTLRSLNVFLAGLLGFLSVVLQFQPLHGAESALYPVALIPAATTIYRIGSFLQDWLKSFSDKRAAQEILVNNTILNQPTTTQSSETPTSLF
jgi:hypothetical protein